MNYVTKEDAKLETVAELQARLAVVRRNRDVLESKRYRGNGIDEFRKRSEALAKLTDRECRILFMINDKRSI